MNWRALIAALVFFSSASSFAQVAQDGVTPPPLVPAAEPVAAPAPGENDYSVPPSFEAPAQPAPAPETLASPAPEYEAKQMRFIDPDRVLNRVSWGPLPAIGGTLTFEYERVVSDKISVFVGPRLALLGGFGVGGSAGARFFLGESQAPSGLWVGPELYISHETARIASLTSTLGQTVTLTGLALGLIGYTWVGESGFSASVGGGGGVGYMDRVTSGTIPTSPFFPTTATNFRGPTLSLAVHANIGYAF